MFVTEERQSSVDWNETSSIVDWGAPVASTKNDDLVLNWDDDDEDKG